MRYRWNVNDENFDYYALRQTQNINSDYSLFAGGAIGYKMFDNKYLIILPKIGIESEFINTGLSDENYVSNNNKYDAKTVHFLFGLSAMIPIRNIYLGLEINYHYCPYELNKNMRSKIESNLISTEVFWRL